MMYGLLVLSLLVVGPPLVVAAPIQITDGTLTFSSPLFVLGAFSLSNADRSFQASGAVNAVLTPFGPAQMCVPWTGWASSSTGLGMPKHASLSSSTVPEEGNVSRREAPTNVQDHASRHPGHRG